jgi:phenylpyruvate tautomerase PptA (4-oxalocrotonate tautomerase family)
VLAVVRTQVAVAAVAVGLLRLVVTTTVRWLKTRQACTTRAHAPQKRRQLPCGVTEQHTRALQVVRTVTAVALQKMMTPCWVVQRQQSTSRSGGTTVYTAAAWGASMPLRTVWRTCSLAHMHSPHPQFTLESQPCAQRLLHGERDAQKC